MSANAYLFSALGLVVLAGALEMLRPLLCDLGHKLRVRLAGWRRTRASRMRLRLGRHYDLG